MSSALDEIRARIEQACQKAGRSVEGVTLIAVSKKQPIEAIQDLYDQGIRNFGENYLQELIGKKDQLPADIHWHFIGDVQSRKIAQLAQAVATVHSTDRDSQLKNWAKVKRARPEILLQVNIASESTKSGVALAQVGQWCDKFKQAEIELAGLMVFPPYQQNPEDSRPFFAKAKALQAEIQAMRDLMLPCSILSMGVSHDFEVAIEEGATHVRVGTALFGKRS